METLLGFAGFLALPIGLVVAVLFAIWIIKANARDNKKYKQETQERANQLRAKGITAPAVIISAKNGIVQGAKNNQRMLVTFEVEVQPEGRPAFQTTFKDLVPVGSSYSTWGDRPQDVGRKIWVTYDPNDITQIMFEYYDEKRKYMLGRPAFDQMEKRNKSIRETGEEAVGTILETEDLEITNVIERDHLQQTIMRVKLEIVPQNGQPYKAETQALFVNASLPKYQKGKKVIVKFNPQDRTQVALIRSMD